MRLDDLTPIEKRIITNLRNIYKGVITIPVSDGIIQEPEIRMPLRDLTEKCGKA